MSYASFKQAMLAEYDIEINQYHSRKGLLRRSDNSISHINVVHEIAGDSNCPQYFSSDYNYYYIEIPESDLNLFFHHHHLGTHLFASGIHAPTTFDRRERYRTRTGSYSYRTTTITRTLPNRTIPLGLYTIDDNFIEQLPNDRIAVRLKRN